MASPSAEENELIETFRKKLTDLNLDDEKQSDMYLVRFLRARDLSLSKAEDMFRKHIAWIVDNDIDKIMAWEPPKFFHDECPYELSGFDKQGCPIFIAPFGIWDVRKICDMKEKANYIRYVDQLFMKVLRSMAMSTENNNNTPITQFVAVFLPDNLQAFRQMSSIQAVDAVLETVKRFEANHPERLKAAFIVDAPRAFSVIFSAIKPLLNGRTLGKVTIATNESDWKPKLFEIVDPSQVPKRLGGTGVSSISFFNEEKGGVHKYLSEKRLVGQKDQDDFLQVKINAGKNFKLDYDVEEPGSTIAWAFKTDGYDIGYSVLFEDKNEIIPYERVETQKEPQTGTVLCKNCGKYTIVFDNTYSRMRSKVLQYKVSLLEAINSFEDQYQSTFL